jgi:hypothetical protein
MASIPVIRLMTQTEVMVDRGIPGEGRQRITRSRITGPVQSADHGRRQSGRIAYRHQGAEPSILQNLSRAAGTIGRDDPSTGGKRLNEDRGQPLPGG